ncbi:MAG: adenosylcobalamin-dependent ribonucleoside-diphosphate reductase [Candidatus Thermoplasmatota archaeon]|nr:adenosylcobalamin-dependent ribonucleoside-diphosphate reductase [Candidatus Thermoplasmatota archaeon]MCL5954835.1 adenosylcobalamin-dependent ribonucleoside-diphosphate reductase [Candidatus Thermoplasmatota archaeon]
MINEHEHKIKKIIKRDGTEVDFVVSKISRAIYKAMLSVKTGSMKEADEIAAKVVSEVEKETLTPTVEQVQDKVENVLMTTSKKGNRYNEVARAYILYREKRRTIREEKARLGVTDDLKLSINAIKTLEARYLLKDEDGKIVETPTQMFRRVASHVGVVELLYDFRTYQKTGKAPKDGKVFGAISKTQMEVLERAHDHLINEKELKGTFEEFLNFVYSKPTTATDTIEKYYDVMCNLEFVPNSPTLMNAGARLGQLSACFVLPVSDSIEDIFESLKYQAMIHKSGGGTGFSFSRLRERDDLVGSTKGVASGPVSFMKIFDVTTDIIKQGGKRRGANMGILRYDHPDIMDFILSKDAENTILSNFNISVGMDDEFFEKLDSDDYIELRSPRSGKIINRIKAKTMWDTIINKAWQTADPGLIFLDEMNRKNPVRHIADIEATNPCGEQPLMPYEPCNLGSINLSKFVKNGEVDWNHLKEVVHLSTKFLDNVIDANKFPVDKIEKMARTTRKIGLGYMGFADLLMLLGISYNSGAGLEMAERVMSFLDEESHSESEILAVSRGVFPGWYGSTYEKEGLKRRNSTTTTIAPTGTISIIANCSSSIEPLFALAFVRHVLNGQELMEINPIFEQVLKDRNLYSEDLMHEVARTGNLHEIDLPEDIKRLFVTAHEIDPEWHVLMQATFQRYCDSGVSKTINLPSDATPQDIAKAYLMAHELHCKGITVYRDRSKSEQVLYSGTQSRLKEKKKAPEPKQPEAEKQTIELIKTVPDKYLKLDATFDPACPTGKCDK